MPNAFMLAKTPTLATVSARYKRRQRAGWKQLDLFALKE
jgi:hypothetical protein